MTRYVVASRRGLVSAVALAGAPLLPAPGDANRVGRRGQRQRIAVIKGGRVSAGKDRVSAPSADGVRSELVVT